MVDTKTKPRAVQALTVSERIRNCLMESEGLIAAKAKLNELYVQSDEFTAGSVKTSSDEIARILLRGEELPAAKPTPTKETVEAFQIAIQRQKRVVADELSKAQFAIREELADEYKQRSTRMHAAVAELNSAVVAMQELREVLSREAGDPIFAFGAVNMIWKVVPGLVNESGRCDELGIR